MQETTRRAQEQLQDLQATVERSLAMRDVRLADMARELGDFGVEHTEALDAAREEHKRAEQRWERKLNETAKRLKGPHEKCVLCLDAIRHGEQVVRLPCQHAFHKNCMLPRLRNRSITRCPVDRITVEHSAVNRLPVFVWGSAHSGDDGTVKRLFATPFEVRRSPTLATKG